MSKSQIQYHFRMQLVAVNTTVKVHLDVGMFSLLIAVGPMNMMMNVLRDAFHQVLN